MERWPSKGPLGVALLAAVVLSIVASFTRSFTLPADVVTALPCGAGAIGVLARYRGRLPAGLLGAGRSGTRPSGRRLSRQILPGTGLSEPDGPPRWFWVVPVATVLVVIAWELAALVGSPRIEHPTLSSLIDIVDGSRPGKGVAFALWLLLGWWLILGREPTPPARGPAPASPTVTDLTVNRRP